MMNFSLGILINIFGDKIVSKYYYCGVLRVCLDWRFRRGREGRVHFYFLNYEQYKMYFKNNPSVFKVLYDHLSCC